MTIRPLFGTRVCTAMTDSTSDKAAGLLLMAVAIGPRYAVERDFELSTRLSTARASALLATSKPSKFRFSQISQWRGGRFNYRGLRDDLRSWRSCLAIINVWTLRTMFMRKLSFHDALQAGRLFRLLTIGAVAVLAALACPGATAWAQTAERRTDPAIRPEFREPVTLASKDGVLEVRLTARQGQATLDTVATPVQNFLLFDYEVIRGTASDGKMSGGNLYPAPTLQVFPGERLIVHLENGLAGLTIRDYFSPQYTPKGQPVPIYPEQMTSSPLNLHTHGLHVSPKGNADNVLLHIPPGMSNTYTYDIPRNMPQGAYWYHSHLHGLTSAQVYMGLVGLLAIGRTDGNLPLVTEKSIPIRNMALQYNFVFDRAGGLAQLNNPNWPQWVSSITPPKGDELANGTYRPLLAPVNFNQSKPGTKYLRSGMRGRSRSTTIAGASSSFPAICSASPRRTAKPTGMCRQIHRSPITNAMCNSRSTASSSRSSRARPARPRSGCSRM